MPHKFYVTQILWHGSRYWKTDSLELGEVTGWNTRYLPYVVARITEKRIVVCAVLADGLGDNLYLARATMERDGKQYHTRFHEYFYAEKPTRGSRDWNWAGSSEQDSWFLWPWLNDNDYLDVLGLSAPFTAKDVKRAYKRLALKAHPDLGGSNAAFIKLKQAHDSALRFASA